MNNSLIQDAWASLGGQEEKGLRETELGSDLQKPQRVPLCVNKRHNQRAWQVEATLEIIPNHPIYRWENRGPEGRNHLLWDLSGTASVEGLAEASTPWLVFWNILIDLPKSRSHQKSKHSKPTTYTLIRGFWTSKLSLCVTFSLFILLFSLFIFSQVHIVISRGLMTFQVPNSTDIEARRQYKHHTQVLYVKIVWLWASYLSSLCLSFRTSRKVIMMRIIIIKSLPGD